MYAFDNAIVNRTCLVCAHDFLGKRNKLYCSDECQTRASRERNYWPKATRELESQGWLVHTSPIKGEQGVSTHVLAGGTRRFLLVDLRAPLSSLLRECRDCGQEYPFPAWEGFEPGTVSIPPELLKAAFDQYGKCGICHNIVPKADYIESLHTCTNCIDRADQALFDGEIQAEIRKEDRDWAVFAQRLHNLAEAITDEAVAQGKLEVKLPF